MNKKGKKPIKLEKICIPREKFQNLINVGPLFFNKAVGPGKKPKINKHRAYVYSGL